MEEKVDERDKEADIKQVKKDWELKKYIVIALVVFITFCCCSLFFFMIYRYHGLAAYWQKMMGVLQPITIGLVIAYLINPVMIFLERLFNKFFSARIKEERKVKKLSRSLATAGALVFLLLVIFLLLAMLIPELIKSIQNMVTTLPDEVDSFIKWIKGFLAGDTQMAKMVEDGIIKATDVFENWLQTDVITQINSYLASITNGVINVVKVLFNFIIGLIISIYVLMSKETFIGQGKKLIYAIFPPKQGNIIIKTARKSNQIFGGFISGKILDSIIIGILCYIVLVIMKMPYSLLVSVIVGVTNVIPFFGPYIGAVPSVILITLADPIQGLYFLIFILILQQIDGNIIGPKILGDSTGLSSFWVVFAILVGGGLFGFMGMILGVPVFAVIYFILREVVAFVLRRKRLPEATINYITMEGINVKSNTLEYEEKHKNRQKGKELNKEEKPK